VTRSSRLLVGLLAISLLPVTGGTALGQQLAQIERELGATRDQRVQVEQRLAAAAETHESLTTRIAELEQDTQATRAEVDRLRGELFDVGALVRFRVREAYKHGSTLDPLAVFLASDDPSAALSRAQTVQRVVSGDRARSEALVAARTRLEAAEGRLVAQQEELEEARREQSMQGEVLREQFDRLRTLEGQLSQAARAERDRLEVERRRRAAAEAARREAANRSAAANRSSAPTTRMASGSMACPLDRPRHFIDSWGHSRSGGRAHRGTDIMGPRGIPVRAITSGVWQVQRPGRSAGNWGILRGDNGHHYWYMHLERHTVGSGTRVVAGQQVGTNGSTGNATAGAEHVHFEVHPGGGSAVNPYPLLRSVCG